MEGISKSIVITLLMPKLWLPHSGVESNDTYADIYDKLEAFNMHAHHEIREPSQFTS